MAATDKGKQAKKRKPRRPPEQKAPAFSPGLPGAPLAGQQRAARKRVERAQRRLPERAVPTIPVLTDFTPVQQETARKLVRRSRRQQAGPGPGLARRLAEVDVELQQDPRSRRRLAAAREAGRQEVEGRERGRAVLGPQALRVAARPGVKRGPIDRAFTDAGAHLAAGGVGPGAGNLVNLARGVLYETPRAYIEGKGKPLEGDARFLKDAVSGAVKLGVAALPGGAPLDQVGREVIESTKEGYKRRYGPLLRGDFPQFRKVTTEEGGLPTLLDVGAIIAPSLKGLGASARTGALGRRAEVFTSRPRARRRTSFGSTRRQVDETDKLFPNPARIYTQRRRDSKRTRRDERLDAKRVREAEPADVGRAPEGTRRAVRPHQVRGLPKRGRDAVAALGGRVVKDKRGRVDFVEIPGSAPRPAIKRAVESFTGQGWTARRSSEGGVRFFAPREVVSRERILGVPTGRVRERQAQRLEMAGLKGEQIQALRIESADFRREFDGAMKPLSRPERAAVFYGHVGLVSLDDPVKARGHLERRVRQIEGVRAGGRSLSRFEQDELKAIRYLLDNADEAFTPALRAAVKVTQGLVRESEHRNIRLDPRRALRARQGPVAQFLGIEPEAVVQNLYDAPATGKSIERQRRKKLVPAQRKLEKLEAGKLRADQEAVRLAQSDQLRPARSPKGFVTDHDQAVVRNVADAARDRVRELTGIQQRGLARGDSLRAQIRVDREAGDMERVANGEAQLDAQLKDDAQTIADLNRANAELAERQAKLEVALTGQPDLPANEVTWYHGTSHDVRGDQLTGEGADADLGPYLTSDPDYAADYSGGTAPGARTVLAHLNSDKVLEARWGRLDPDVIVRVIDGVLAAEQRLVARARRVIEHERAAGLPETPNLGVFSESARRRLLEGREWLASDETFRAAARGENYLKGGLDDWKALDRLIMREQGWSRAAQVIAELEKRYGLPVGPTWTRKTGLQREAMKKLGFDAIRKADTSGEHAADALVVLNEKLLRVPGRGLGPDALDAAAVAQRLADEARRQGEIVRGFAEQLVAPDAGKSILKIPETAGQFARRVREARQAEGLDAPGFAPSEQFGARRFADHTVGGTALVRGSHRRTYSLQKRGVQRADPEVIFQGIQRNLKQRHNAELILRSFDRIAHPGARRMSVVELKRFMQREGLDPSQVAIWFPGRFEERLRALGERGEDLRAEGRAPQEASLGDPGLVGDELEQALRDSSLRQPPDVNDATGWEALAQAFEGQGGALIPRAAYNEIFDSTKGDSAAGRIAQRVSSLQSRAVLGTFNVNWLLADTVANGAMAHLMAGVTPATYWKASAFWKELPPEVRKQADALLDIGSFKSQTHVPHLGSTVNNSWINTWRALRSIPPGESARPLTKAAGMVLRARPVQRSIDTFLAAERTIANTPPRRAVFYKLLRDEAFRSMDAEMGFVNQAMNRVVGHLTKSPEDMMRALAKDRRVLEDIAQGVDKALGDYSGFTAVERRFIGRYFFFYPYARFATRALFYTLPVEHPIRMSIALRLGALTEEEQRELLGVAEDEIGTMRGLMFGRLVYRDEKTGELREQNVRSVNPFGNPITESKGSESVLGILPPVYQWALGQIEKRDVYRDQPWNVRGEFTRPTSDPDTGGLLETASIRGRILLRNLLELPVPTRELSKHFLPGPQSTESLPIPGLQRPLRHKSPERLAEDLAKTEREASDGLFDQVLRSQLRLFFGKPSDIEGQIERRRRAKGKPKRDQAKGKPGDYSGARVPGSGGKARTDYSKARVPGR